MSETPTEADARPLEKSPIKRLVSRLLLVAGVTFAVSLTLPATPRDQELVFRFGSGDDKVRRIALSFTKSGEKEARSGFTLSYPEGAPARARHKVALPNGEYSVSGEVERRADDGGPSETSFVRRVNLQGGETVLPLENAP